MPAPEKDSPLSVSGKVRFRNSRSIATDDESHAGVMKIDDPVGRRVQDDLGAGRRCRENGSQEDREETTAHFLTRAMIFCMFKPNIFFFSSYVQWE